MNRRRDGASGGIDFVPGVNRERFNAHHRANCIASSAARIKFDDPARSAQIAPEFLAGAFYLPGFAFMSSIYDDEVFKMACDQFQVIADYLQIDKNDRDRLML